MASIIRIVRNINQKNRGIIMRFIKTTGLLVIMSFLLVFGTACGNGGANGNGEGGTVAIDGSSTVLPIMEGISEEFTIENPSVQVPVNSSGTGGGFEKFIAGETDLSNASRPIKQEEIDGLKEAGIDYTELILAYDGLSVVVSKENDFVDSLTVDELRKMWLEDGGVKTWKDIRSEWPAEEIKFFSPGTDSGTYDYWNEVILEDNPMRRDAQLSEDDNVLVQGVAGTKNGIGYFGYAYYIENKDSLKVVPIDNGNGPVEPNGDTIQSGKYSPLSRPLFTYVKNDSLKNNETVYDYVTYTLENAGTIAEEVGYVALPEEKYTQQLEKIKEVAGK
jgi:phosphate transport system substrate-binding protein